MFIWPTDVRRITSHHRTASRPNHNGLDIAQPGTHEIFAAAAGTISRSYNSTSYGECIMILHSVNGQAWETVYAHMRSGSRRLKAGDRVKQGQTIGIMGNTGNSTGQHLHFEIHKGRWNVSKSNAVNPINFLTQYGNESEKTPSGATYTVKSGDTLSKVAAKHHMTVNELTDLNGIKNKHLIYPGQVLHLKAASIYKVKKGDTISEIAAKYKTTVNRLVSLNNIKDKNKISIGQTIRLP